MAFTAIYDANVLHPASLRDLLVRLGMTGLFRARWTEEILDEMVDRILRHRRDLDRDRLAQTRELMCDAVPDCLVDGYKPLIDALELSFHCPDRSLDPGRAVVVELIRVIVGQRDPPGAPIVRSAGSATNESQA